MVAKRLMAIACLMFTPALSFADEQTARFCYLQVRLGGEVFAQRKPCIESDEHAFEISGLKVKYQLLRYGARLEIGPRTFVFLNGKQKQFVNTGSQGALAVFYDTSSADYVDGAYNEPAGVIGFRVLDE